MRAYLLLFALIGIGFVSGCSKSEPETRTGNPGPTTGAAPVVTKVITNKADNLVRIHFIGTTQLLADTNSARLKEVFDLPSSKALSEDILQKLATTPYRLFEKKLASGSKPEAELIRPMVEDMLHAESYIEMRGVTNAIPETLIAVRLENDRADYWSTNIASILKSWTALSTSDIEVDGFKGWELKKHKDPNTISFLRAGDWVVFGWGKDKLLLLPDLLAKIKSENRPVPVANDYYLHAWVDGPAVRRWETNLPFAFPVTDVTVSNTKNYLRTKAIMSFAEPLNLTLEPWHVPTNIVQDPLISFTAVRGIGPWLQEVPQIKALNLDKLPNQYFLWAIAKIPFETSIVAPVKDGTNYMARVATNLLAIYNSKLEKRSYGQLEWKTNDHLVVLTGIPMVFPYLKLLNTQEGDFIKFGLFPGPAHRTPPPAELLAQLENHTNLVYYDWEITRERLPQVRNVADLLCIISGKQFVTSAAPVQKWLEEVAPKLGDCGTVGTLTAPNEVTFIRNGSIGLTAFELTMLKRWVAAPGFPLSARIEHLRPTPRNNSTNAPVALPPPVAVPGTNSTN